ncbi:MAG: hypothetical protein D6814_04100 [Calditrichaeota bacterium]|nr:MAG: hypothetical protein D6814_04100 [Calditrichota bacterium]
MNRWRPLFWGGLLIVSLVFSLSCQKGGTKLPAEKVRDLANALYNRELFKQSIAEYEYYLQNYKLSEEEQANISYVIANIYFDRLKDYENALAYYVRIKELYPQSKVATDTEKRIVACLERLQRSADAQQALEEATFLDPSKAKKQRPGEVVAKIGNREITTGDLEYEMNQLPKFMLEQINDRSKKLEFLKQYIATELLYDTARRKGLDRDPQVIEAAFQAKKRAMVEKLLQQELSQNLDVNDEDLQLYYNANKAKYVQKDEASGKTRQLSFEEARQAVLKDYIAAKQKSAYERLVNRMMRAEAVEIYEDKIQ